MIPLADPKRAYFSKKSELKRAIERVLKSGTYILGKEVETFEKEFAAYVGCKYAVGVASGTEALSLALVACGVKPGDNVIVPANAYPTAFAISAVGAIPKLIDVNLESYTLDERLLEKAIDNSTKAIIPVHLYGQAANLSPILRIAKEYNLPVIEDCAQAHGSLYKGKKVGAFGQLSCFSFYPTKNLGAFGDGGIVLSNSKQLIKRVKLLRMYGEKRRYRSIMLGYNSRLDELQAAMLRVLLGRLDQSNEKRRKLATLYDKLLRGVNELTLPKVKHFNTHTYHLYVILCKRRNQLQKYLSESGIATGTHYPIPIHLQKSYKFLGYSRGDFPVSEYVAESLLSLPMYPTLGRKNVKYICQKIREFYQ